VAFDQTERIQLAGRTFIYKNPEVAPVDIATFAWQGFHANKGTARDGSFADGPKVILYNGDAAAVAEWTQALSDDGRVGGRVLLKQFGDGGFEEVEFAGAVTAGRLLHWGTQILRESAAADPQMLRDLTQRPFLHPVETMNFADLVRCEHRQTPL
jgi:hypothetical protein